MPGTLPEIRFTKMNDTELPLKSSLFSEKEKHGSTSLQYNEIKTLINACPKCYGNLEMGVQLASSDKGQELQCQRSDSF